MIEVLPPGAGGVDDVMTIDMWIYRCHDVMMWGGVDVDAYLALIWIFDAYLWLRSFAWRNIVWLCNNGNMGMGKTYTNI